MSRTLISPARRFGTLALAIWVAGCSSLPPPRDDGALQREAMAGTEKPAPAPLPLNTGIRPDQDAAVQPQLNVGSGQFIKPTGLSSPRKLASGDGAVTFNFENQPVPAVVKAILGDLLKQNYTIVPGVQGNVSFSTAEPVDSSQALPILETLLAWTGNALVQRDGGYVVMPAKDAVAGNLVPSLGAAAPQAGLQARLFSLRYIAATEMQKLIKPFARADAVLLVDSSRNLLVMSGTPQELTNYQRTINTFDVDWLRGMSVGVFSLKHATVAELLPRLDGMFGAKGDTPLAGMFRFIPIERTNALVVISTQPSYLHEIGGWIEKIDRGGGNEPELFVYDVRNLKASDLAQYLAQIYAGGGGGGSGGKVGPGLNAGTLGSSDNANGSASGMGSTAGSFGSSTSGGIGGGTGGIGGGTGGIGGGLGGGTGGLGSSGGGSGGIGGGIGGGLGSSGSSFGGRSGAGGGGIGGGSGSQGGQQYASEDGSIRISSVDDNNQLLVRARPSQWAEIEAAIKKLDNTPLQVQIETRILEVSLTNQFQFGVQWYLEGLTGSTSKPDGSGGTTITPGEPYRHRQIGLGSGGNTFNGEPFFYSFMNSNMQVAVRALETSGNTKTLSAPSLVVLNNQTAQIQVGDQVPINTTSVNPGVGTATYNSVNYLSTGVILAVQPRVNPGGLVYLNIQQQVSTPTTAAGAVNPTVSQRAMSTQVAVQSGQTVLLGGLIQQNDQNNDNGVPGLSRIPYLGRLFGTTSRNRKRTELIVLITPKVITSGEEAKQVTDEYQQKFESLTPLRQGSQVVPAAKP
ncbi:type II secretion system secretin GspD [Dyella tabacisoli]|uniref:Type II secretion system protein GspD n=1 Tax=Dyella tabacisoli TaxID=2282381 RepID=A0A369UQX6_9GAMM|nr:type II secretion system secretin GspD [Dyella tabacisoli]RDD80719.1 type II secretion system protein GspD [Dyella tabacisoli]